MARRIRATAPVIAVGVMAVIAAEATEVGAMEVEVTRFRRPACAASAAQRCVAGAGEAGASDGAWQPNAVLADSRG